MIFNSKYLIGLVRRAGLVFAFPIAVLAALPARADVVHISPSNLADVQVNTVAGTKCWNSSDPSQYQLSISTGSQTVTRKYCYGDFDQAKWQRLYEQTKLLLIGLPGKECLAEEYCDRHGCRRLYGDTVADQFEILIFSSPAGEINDYEVVLKTHCQRR